MAKLERLCGICGDHISSILDDQFQKPTRWISFAFTDLSPNKANFFTKVDSKYRAAALFFDSRSFPPFKAFQIGLINPGKDFVARPIKYTVNGLIQIVFCMFQYML